MLQTIETSAAIYPAFYNPKYKRYLALIPYRQKDYDAWPEALHPLLANPKFAVNVGVRTHAFTDNKIIQWTRPLVSNADGAILVPTANFPQDNVPSKVRTFGLYRLLDPIQSEITKFQNTVINTPFTLSLRRAVDFTIEQLLSLMEEANRLGYVVNLDKTGIAVKRAGQVRYFKFSAHETARNFIQTGIR